MKLPDIQLETERLILRIPQRGDLDAMAAFMADEESTRYLGGVQARSPAWRALASQIGSWVMEGYAMFSVIEKSSGLWVGRIGPWQPEGWPGTEVGWGITREHWGKGYAPEAATAAMDWAFNNLGWVEIIHTIAPENHNSKVVASKLGSSYLRMGALPEPHHEHAVEIWGQSREQWRARR